MRKRIGASLMAVVMAASLMAGCGNDAASTTGAAENQSSDEAKVTEGSRETGENTGSSGERETLVVEDAVPAIYYRL